MARKKPSKKPTGRPAKVYKPITDIPIDFSNTENIVNLMNELGKRLLAQEVHPAVAGTVNGLVTNALRIHSLPFDRLAEFEKDLAAIKQERDIAARNGWLTPRLPRTE